MDPTPVIRKNIHESRWPLPSHFLVSARHLCVHISPKTAKEGFICRVDASSPLNTRGWGFHVPSFRWFLLHCCVTLLWHFFTYLFVSFFVKASPLLQLRFEQHRTEKFSNVFAFSGFCLGRWKSISLFLFEIDFIKMPKKKNLVSSWIRHGDRKRTLGTYVTAFTLTSGASSERKNQKLFRWTFFVLLKLSLWDQEKITCHVRRILSSGQWQISTYCKPTTQEPTSRKPCLGDSTKMSGLTR